MTARPADAAATPAWIAAAALVVVLPTLLAYNPPPSATFLNQAAAFIGWGVLVLLLADAPGTALRSVWQMPGGILLAALLLLALAAAAGLSVWHNSSLAFGPAFGCFIGERLVAMAATKSSMFLESMSPSPLGPRSPPVEMPRPDPWP